MRANVLLGLGIAFCIPVFDAIAQEDAAMQTSCSVDDTSWRWANTFTVEAKRQTDEAWYYEDKEITHSFKQIASQTMHTPGDRTYDYTFVSDSSAQLKCMVESIRRGTGGNNQELKFITAYCEGDQPYECTKNYRDNKEQFRVRFTIIE